MSRNDKKRDDDFDDMFREGGGDDDFGGFDDFDDDVDLDTDNLDLSGAPDLGEDEPVPSDQGGRNRTFVILAILLILILLLGFGVLIFAISSQGDPLAPTRTAIAQINATTEAQIAGQNLALTEQANTTATAAFFAPTLTQEAAALGTQAAAATATNDAQVNATLTAIVAATGTALALPTETPTLSPTPAGLAQVPSPTDDLGSGGGGDEATPTREGGGLALEDVQATATALAAIFNQARTPTATSAAQGGPATAIPGGSTGGGTGGGSDSLPDTGLFDDVLASSPWLLAAIAAGLVGLIAVARRTRAINRKALAPRR